ncbi:MAG: biosynthetic arginine decarboxylase [Bacteriovoracaceae bacterium]|nr:biosynthetic arginine decarboxylase [Bacteriovoracaceae bacterium]
MTDWSWTKEDADEAYHISRWGDGYFDINQEGHLCVLPNRDPNGPRIDIAEVIEEMKLQNIPMPMVIRFHDILRSQVKLLNETFREVIKEADYPGKYTGVYPIKVNQMREVVEEIVDAGTPYDFGLEAGSKPELLSVLAFNDNLNALTVLNGYKDEEYLRLALLGNKLGRKVIVVIEKFSELYKILKLSREMNVAPMIGLRAKMSVKGSGKWAESGGDKAKFGLTIAEMNHAIQILKEENQLSCLKLFHFHIGSQVTDIRTIKEVIREGGRIYAELLKLGANIEYFDVGGGLGVDYDGSQSTNESSINYNLKDYVSDIVYILKEICAEEKVPAPNIVTESGRAITARHSCVITNVIDKIETSFTEFPTDVGVDEHRLVSKMREMYESLNLKNAQETFNDAEDTKKEALSAFRLGILTLEERAKIETLFWKITKKIAGYLPDMEFIPENLYDITKSIAPQYLCNFSIFQSAPDMWAIGQLLPILPITRLNERPTTEGTLVDITCDSDGKINKFIGIEETRNLLPLHDLKPNEDYFIGLFLTGAYQDVMGDLHNLFGRLNEVHVFCDDEDPTDFYIEEVIKGSSSDTVLRAMQYNPEGMAYTMKKNIDKEIQAGKISPREGVRLIDFYEECLQSYTYLKK